MFVPNFMTIHPIVRRQPHGGAIDKNSMRFIVKILLKSIQIVVNS